MGLKTDIENAFLKNIKVDKDPDYEVSAEGKEKVSELAQDLSDAIVNWVTKQEFKEHDHIEEGVRIERGCAVAPAEFGSRSGRGARGIVLVRGERFPGDRVVRPGG